MIDSKIDVHACFIVIGLNCSIGIKCAHVVNKRLDNSQLPCKMAFEREKDDCLLIPAWEPLPIFCLLNAFNSVMAINFANWTMEEMGCRGRDSASGRPLQDAEIITISPHIICSYKQNSTWGHLDALNLNYFTLFRTAFNQQKYPYYFFIFIFIYLNKQLKK